MASSKTRGVLSFRDNDGNVTKSYNGVSNVTVYSKDLGENYEGVGAVSIEDTASSHQISISLDKAATEAGKTIVNSSIKDIIGFLGGTAVPE